MNKIKRNGFMHFPAFYRRSKTFSHVVEEGEEELASDRRHYSYYFGFYYRFVVAVIVIVQYIEMDENIENIIIESEIRKMDSLHATD